MKLGKVSDLFGFTKTEMMVFAFMSGVFLFGLGIYYYKLSGNCKEGKFDYSASDSLFVASSVDDEDSSSKYRKQVLELKPNMPAKKNNLPAEKSIDLNKAGISELSMLPGVGRKTAEKIIEYRKTYGRFKVVDELLEVKGIGPVKFERIKKYIIVVN
ncbi:MAG: helix-hairpin-helix domain-containing protein [Ignavibacteria bacterium]